METGPGSSLHGPMQPMPSPTFTEQHQARPTSDSFPRFRVGQLENKRMRVQMLGPGDLSSGTECLRVGVRESPQPTKARGEPGLAGLRSNLRRVV